MMSDLLERIEGAERPAIVLDAELFWTLERQRATTAFWRGAMGLPRPLPEEFNRLPRGLGVASMEAASPKYTASLDAALALAERVLPGTTFRIDLNVRPRVWAFDKETFWSLHANISGRSKEWTAYATAATPALALCAAILRARQS